MPGWWADLAARLSFPALAVLAVAGCLAIGLVIRRLFRRGVAPDELEKRRRQYVNLNGKLGDGEIIDVEGAAIVYSYHAGGVGYSTSQDVGVLEDLLPADRLMLIGPVSVKFLPGNPANSIVLCEEWSGLRKHGPGGPKSE
jgi:hypothetical protein